MRVSVDEVCTTYANPSTILADGPPPFAREAMCVPRMRVSVDVVCTTYANPSTILRMVPLSCATLRTQLSLKMPTAFPKVNRAFAREVGRWCV